MTTVYFACNLSIYDTPRYKILLRFIRKSYPDAIILEPKTLYINTPDWLRKWPDLLIRTDIFIFAGKPGGMIGRGVYQEVLDSVAAGKPIFYLDSRLHLFPAERISLRLIGESGDSFASVVISRRKEREVS